MSHSFPIHPFHVPLLFSSTLPVSHSCPIHPFHIIMFFHLPPSMFHCCPIESISHSRCQHHQHHPPLRQNTLTKSSGQCLYVILLICQRWQSQAFCTISVCHFPDYQVWQSHLVFAVSAFTLCMRLKIFL